MNLWIKDMANILMVNGIEYLCINYDDDEEDD